MSSREDSTLRQFSRRLFTFVVENKHLQDSSNESDSCSGSFGGSSSLGSSSAV